MHFARMLVEKRRQLNIRARGGHLISWIIGFWWAATSPPGIRDTSGTISNTVLAHLPMQKSHRIPNSLAIGVQVSFFRLQSWDLLLENNIRFLHTVHKLWHNFSSISCLAPQGSGSSVPGNCLRCSLDGTTFHALWYCRCYFQMILNEIQLALRLFIIKSIAWQ